MKQNLIISLNQLNSSKKLYELLSENPNLPIVPIVDSEVVGDEYGNYTGEILGPHIGEYAIQDGIVYESRDSFKQAYCKKYCDELCEKFNYVSLTSYTDDTYLNIYLENEVCEKLFQKAILFYIYNANI